MIDDPWHGIFFFIWKIFKIGHFPYATIPIQKGWLLELHKNAVNFFDVDFTMKFIKKNLHHIQMHNKHLITHPCYISHITRYMLYVLTFEIQLPVQSVTITTEVVSLNPAHDEEYSIQHYVIKFVSDLM
jgi:hypothetical protein